jgi:hypothetical protein
MSTMLTPSLPSSDDRGTRWLQAQVQQILADGAVSLAPPRCEGDPSCYWGTALETDTTLYVRLAGDPEPTALYFRRAMIMGCGSGLYSMQHNAILLIRRTLTKMGILSA